MRTVGTSAYGVRTPIIRNGDNLVKIVADCVENTVKDKNIELHDKDIIAITEAVVGISEGNFVSEEQVAQDIRKKMGAGKVGVIFPIFSRNRFSVILSSIVKGVDEVVLQLSYPSDEVGNPLVSKERLYDLGIVTYDKEYTSEEFYKLVGKVEHPFTGLDYIKYYQDIIGKNAKIILSNNPCTILKYTDKVIAADIHTKEVTKKLLKSQGAKIVCSLDDFVNKKTSAHGYNTEHGLLGSNKSTEGNLKLFPMGGQKIVEALQKEMKKRTGKTLECMVFGDGAFKDPVGGIWELADPVVSPAYTKGLDGTPNEIKLKYVADNQLKDVSRDQFDDKMRDFIKNKKADLKAQNVSLGTTPRRYVDLIGSLCDLVCGSGDKGTPVVLITGYFDNYSNN